MFCVICFENCDFHFRRRDSEIYSTCADAEMEKERVQRDKNGNMNNVAFYAVSSSAPYGYLCSKLKTQKSKHRSHQFRTQNTKHLYTKHNVTYRLPYRLTDNSKAAFLLLFLSVTCCYVCVYNVFSNTVY